MWDTPSHTLGSVAPWCPACLPCDEWPQTAVFEGLSLVPFHNVPVAHGPLKSVYGADPSQGLADSRFRTSALDEEKLECLA